MQLYIKKIGNTRYNFTVSPYPTSISTCLLPTLFPQLQGKRHVKKFHQDYHPRAVNKRLLLPLLQV